MKFPIVNQASPLFLATIIGIVNVRHVASAKCGDPWREPCLGDTDARYKTDRNYDIEAQSDLAVGQSLPSHSEDSVGLIMHARIPARRCTICAMSAKRFQSLMVCLSWSGPSALRNPTSILTYGTNSFIHPSIICLAPLHYLLFDHKEAFQGYYVCDMYTYGPDGQPLQSRQVDVPGVGLLAFGTFPYKIFTNYTVAGTRSYSHRYNILPPVLAPGGAPFGISRGFDLYSTSTFELDGRFITLPYQANSNATDGLFTDDEVTVTYQVGNDTLFAKTIRDVTPGTFLTTSQTCLKKDCDTVRELASIYESFQHTSSQGCTNQRISEQEFVEGIAATYQQFMVPESARVSVPMADSSLSGSFPGEEEWCKFDPNCATDPYQEPTTPVKPGVIAGFTIGGVLVFLIAVSVGIYVYNKQQAKRYRTIFATRVAQTMSIRVPARRMDAAALAREFQKIDAQTTAADSSNRRASSVGNITKEGMWEFLSSGKAVEMNRHDFEALWAVMDADGSGYVDFLEFCAFMGQCHEEYDNARDDRMLMAERLSRRFSLRLSQIEENSAQQAASEIEAIAGVDADADADADAKADAGDSV
eukprot:CAMPEP_0198133634 /NCGR_PEP_ID=MMETSP1442-20131203/59668_1 /TAXON_ID= /ORGANISM="Craspedostauros australis, Strain CCMP3328" /LENGTH=586 /DNA_ID=CAMNT_0043794765 /DNA_START=209 /DNA_END=1970 /DNA_ORIENTATION=-